MLRQVSVSRVRGEPSPIALGRQIVRPGAIHPVSHGSTKGANQGVSLLLQPSWLPRLPNRIGHLDSHLAGRLSCALSRNLTGSQPRRKYCRSGIDPFGEPGPRPLVLPADATRRNQQNLTWPATYNEPLLEYLRSAPQMPVRRLDVGLGRVLRMCPCGAYPPRAVSDRNRWSERKTVTGRPQSRPSGSGQTAAGQCWCPARSAAWVRTGTVHAPADAKGLGFARSGSYEPA